ncbi:MAG: hypothetical protein KBE22_05190 [Candidatus Accumulibacter sp.]|nr:hypothetical protein [Accumulibacter sp.]
MSGRCSLPDRIRFARNGLDLDAFFRLRCPDCRSVTVFLADDASHAQCRSCQKVFTDGSLVLPPARHGHCWVCRLVGAGWLDRGVKRCIPCQVDWEEHGERSGQQVRQLETVRYRLRLADLLPDAAATADGLERVLR